MGRTVGLTAKQKLFVKRYLVDKNATEAYATAYNKTNMGSSGVEGHRMLKKPKIRAAIDAGLAKLEQKLDITAERVLSRIAEFAFKGKIKFNQLKPQDILKALELLGKHFNQFGDGKNNPSSNGLVVKFNVIPNGSEKEEPGNATGAS